MRPKLFIRCGLLSLFLISFGLAGSAEFELLEIKLPTTLQGGELYKLIGLDLDTYKQKREEARSIVKGAMDRAKRALESHKAAPKVADLTEYTKRLEGLQNFYERKKAAYETTWIESEEGKAFNAWAVKEIKKGCHDTRRRIRSELEEKESEVKVYPSGDLRVKRLNKEIAELKKDLERVAKGCPLLLDPKYRVLYDEQILRPGVTAAQAGQAYEKVLEKVEEAQTLSTDTKVFLNALVGDILSKYTLPGPATKLFNQNLALREIRILPKPAGEGIKYFVGFTGLSEINNFYFQASFYGIWDTYNKFRWMFSLATPSAYKISDLFPSFKFFDSFTFPQSKFTVATFDGSDDEGFPFKKGFGITAQWDIFSGLLSSIFNKLKQLTSGALIFETQPVYLTGQIPWRNWAALSQFSANVPVYLGLDFTKMKFVPGAFSRVFNKITTDAFKFSIKPYTHSRSADEQIEIEKLETQKEKLEQEKQKNAFQAEWNVYPQDQKIADLEKEIAVKEKKKTEYEKEEQKARAEKQKKLDEKKTFAQKVQGARPRKSKDYGTVQTKLQEGGFAVGAQLEKGLNIAEDMRVGIGQQLITQKGPLEEVLKKQAESESMLDSMPSKTALSAVEAARKIGFIVEVQTGVIIYLGTQTAPIKLTMKGLAVPPGLQYPQGFLSIIGKMQNLLEFKWLAIGNASLSLDFDFQAVQALIAIGVPFSGLGITGQVALGKPGDARASLKVEAGIATTSEIQPNIVFDVSAENIRLADIASYSTHLAAKAGLPIQRLVLDKLPTMTLHKLWGYVSFANMRIGERQYRAGMGVQVETEFFDKKAGFRIFMGEADKGYSLEGFGYLPSLHFAPKGKTAFRLYGEDQAKGPQLSWDFNPREPLKGSFGLDAHIDIPPLGVSQKAQFQWHGYSITADFVSKFAGLDVLFKIDMNTKEGVVQVSGLDRRIEDLRLKLKDKDLTDARTLAALNLLKSAESKQDQYGLALVNRVATYPGIISGKKSESKKTIRERFKQAVSGSVAAAQLKAVALEGQKAQLKQKAIAIILNEMKLAELSQTIGKLIDEDERSNQKIELQKLTNEQTSLLRLDSIELLFDELQVELDRVVKSVKELVKNQAKREEKTMTKKKVDPQFKKREEEKDPLAKWKGLAITFGFKGDFGKFLNEQAVPMIREWAVKASKRAEEVKDEAQDWGEKGMQAVQQEIDKKRAEVRKLNDEIGLLKEQCSKLPIYKQAGCRATIFNKQVLIKVKLKPIEKLNRALNQGFRGIAMFEQAWKRRYQHLEKISNLLAKGVEAAAKGIQLFNVKEAIGKYSFVDMVGLKLPKLARFVANVTFMDTDYPITLTNLQFDFKRPVRSAKSIVKTLMSAATKALQEQYLEGLPSVQGKIGEIGDPFGGI